MSYLHLLSESENDDLFYEALAERIVGTAFEVIPVRTRRGERLRTVLQLARMLFLKLKRTGAVDDTFFLVAIDNDRAPQFDDDAQPNSSLPETDRKKQNRHRSLLRIAQDVLGNELDKWPIRGAVAVPVEMLESWILLGCKWCRAEDLPIFATSDRPGAKAYYAPHQPPPQLKDLVHCVRAKLGMGSVQEFLLFCATEAIDLEELSTTSRSFRFFLEDLRDWRKE